MKFIAFVDNHGEIAKELSKKIKKNKPDFLACAGDFTIFEHDITKVMKKLSKLNGKLFLIHGNHEEESETRKEAKKYKNIEFVHRRIVEYKDIAVIGWGGGGFTIKDHEFETWWRGVKKKIKLLKKNSKRILFIGHAPFYKTRLDELGDSNHGNKSFTYFMKKFKIDVGLCGHFHENSGKEDTIGKSRVFNPGPKGKVIEI